MAGKLKAFIPSHKIADCDHGTDRRLVVAIGPNGYVKTPYITGELQQPADPRESRDPKPRGPTSFLRIKRKGKR